MPSPLMRDLFTSADLTADPVDVSFWHIGGPLHLPSLTDAEHTELMDQLRPWVAELRVRFHVDVRAVPPCWDQHPGMVEALAALRDAERGAYAETSPAGGGVDFLQALRIVHAFLVEQTALTGCDGHGHREPPRIPTR